MAPAAPWRPPERVERPRVAERPWSTFETVLPSRYVFDQRLTPAGYRVLAAFVAMADPATGTYTGGLRHVADALGLTVTPVAEQARQLQRMGLLVYLGRNRGYVATWRITSEHPTDHPHVEPLDSLVRDLERGEQNELQLDPPEPEPPDDDVELDDEALARLPASIRAQLTGSSGPADVGRPETGAHSDVHATEGRDG